MEILILISEDESLIVQVCGEKNPEAAAPKTKIDAYADAFEAFEKDFGNSSPAQDRSSKGHSKTRSPSRKKESSSNRRRDRSRSRSRTRRSPRRRSRDRRSRSGERKGRARSRSKDRRDARRRTRSKSKDRRDAHRRTRSRSKERRDIRDNAKTRWKSKEAEKEKAHTVDDPKRSRSRSPLTLAKLQAEVDSRVKQFIDQDKVLFSELSTEKSRFKEEPESHPNYTEEWRRFYNEECVKANTRVNSVLLKPKWAAEWDIFLNDTYLHKLTRMREHMMESLRVNKEDVEDYLMREKAATIAAAADVPPIVSSSPVSSEEKFPRPSPAKPSNLFFEYPANRSQPSRIDSEVIPVNPTHPQSAPPPPSREDPNRGREQGGDSEVTVMNTLRLLSAIEHLLDDIGYKIIQSLGRANALEVNLGNGQSVKMLDDKLFFELLIETRKRLQARLVDPKVPERSLNVIRICIDQVTILLQKSSISTIPSSQEPEQDSDSRLRQAIGTTIRDEYARAGVYLTTDQLDILVKNQMDKAREDKSNAAPIRPSEPSSSRPSGEIRGDWGNFSSNDGRVKIKHEPEPIPTMSVKKEIYEDFEREAGTSRQEEENFEEFTIDEVISLFKNFQELGKEHQANLIIYMKKLEITNPDKVALIKRSFQRL